jgi:5-methylcytosine-specific restriction endonuclease McrA
LGHAGSIPAFGTSAMSKKHLTKQRERFWNEDPRCHYCGQITILQPRGMEWKELWGNLSREERHRLATIDHLRPRHHPGRLEPYHHGQEPRRHVLACWKCNNDRDKRELADKPKEWFEQNGGSPPLHKRDELELQNILVLLGRIKPRGRYNRNRVKKSIVDVSWSLWERGMDT